MSKQGPRWTIILRRDAEKTLDRLHGPIFKRINAALAELAENPRPPGYSRLEGYDDLYRIRVGDWRIIYAIEDDRLIVLVVRIKHRRDVYERL